MTCVLEPWMLGSPGALGSTRIHPWSAHPRLPIKIFVKSWDPGAALLTTWDIVTPANSLTHSKCWVSVMNWMGSGTSGISHVCFSSSI